MSGAGELPPEGLDLSRPDEITEGEIESFHAEYERTGKGRLDSFEFWIEFRPDVLKRHKARTPHYFSEKGKLHPLPLQLTAIHQYTAERFTEGVGYELRLAHSNGALRTDLLDTFSIAWLSCGHSGMYAVAAAATEYLRSYEDPDPAREFPPGWSFDPSAFDSGLDYTTAETSRGEMRSLLDWYDDTIGFVPRNVQFLVRNRPGLMKAYRNRYEHAIRDSLPCQMLPYLLLNHSVVEGRREGMRENLLLGRALGITDEQILDSICLGVLFAGIPVLDLVEEAVGDLIQLGQRSLYPRGSTQ